MVGRLPIETKCSNVSAKMSFGDPFHIGGEVMFFTPGPFEGILNLKAQDKPYTLERFRVYGTISVSISAWFPTALREVRAIYLGRGGKEIEIARVTKSVFEVSRNIDLRIDKYLDVYSEFRGLGVQAIKLAIDSYTMGDVTVTGNICYDLTWVG